MDAANRVIVSTMNRVPGMAYPAALGGTVLPPRGLIHTGDVTDFGLGGQWTGFEKIYGRSGMEGVLKCPVFETTGNHDRAIAFNRTVPLGVTHRHGTLPYSWNWDAVHFVCLDMVPTAAGLEWLKTDLAAVDRRAPLVVFFHYTLVGHMSDWWSTRDKDAFAQAIAGYNVVAILTGHYHEAGHDVWRGYDVFRPGSPRGGTQTFIAARITDDRLSLAYYDWGQDASSVVAKPRWGEIFSKPILRTAPAAV
jgi:3',5'-cyclic AMP phosphodiesterase CpdA